MDTFKTITVVPERNKELMEVAARKGFKWVTPLPNGATHTPAYLSETIGLVFRGREMWRALDFFSFLRADDYEEKAYPEVLALLKELPDASEPILETPFIVLQVNPEGVIEFFPEQHEITKSFRGKGYVFRTRWNNWMSLVAHEPRLMFGGFTYGVEPNVWHLSPKGISLKDPKLLLNLDDPSLGHVLVPVAIRFFVVG